MSGGQTGPDFCQIVLRLMLQLVVGDVDVKRLFVFCQLKRPIHLRVVFLLPMLSGILVQIISPLFQRRKIPDAYCHFHQFIHHVFAVICASGCVQVLRSWIWIYSKIQKVLL